MLGPIGILDSGLGGLSVTKEIKKLLPRESIIYFADSRNTPYSSKSEQEIYKLSKQVIEFLLEKKVKIIVIACNTITVMVLERLRSDFPNIPIIGTVPVIKTAVSLTKNGKIGVFSTLKTAQSSYQKNLIKNFAKGLKVINVGSDEVVPLIEQGKYKEVPLVLDKALEPFVAARIDVLVLGCTHFPLVKKEISRIMGEGVMVIDSAEAVARQVKRILGLTNSFSMSENEDTFYTSGGVSQIKQVLKRLNMAGKIIRA